MELKDKVAIVTGGASGLGRATTELFHSLGAKVAIFDMNDELGAEVAQELGEGAHYFNVNVTDENSVSDALAQVGSQMGDVHIACNYAGVGTPGRTLGRDGPLPLDWFKRVVDVNLIGTFNVIRLVAEKMLQHDPVFYLVAYYHLDKKRYPHQISTKLYWIGQSIIRAICVSQYRRSVH